MSKFAALIDQLLTRLTVRYGAAFSKQYDGLDPAMVRQDWMECLSFAERQPDVISYGWQHLDEFAPHAMRFRVLCLPGLNAQRNPYETERIAYDNKASKEGRERIRKVLAEIAARPEEDPKAWARRLRGREQSGERLTAAQRDMWRTALGEDRRQFV